MRHGQYSGSAFVNSLKLRQLVKGNKPALKFFKDLFRLESKQVENIQQQWRSIKTLQTHCHQTAHSNDGTSETKKQLNVLKLLLL
jgi:hypothetical protein